MKRPFGLNSHWHKLHVSILVETDISWGLNRIRHSPDSSVISEPNLCNILMLWLHPTSRGVNPLQHLMEQSVSPIMHRSVWCYSFVIISVHNDFGLKSSMHHNNQKQHLRGMFDSVAREVGASRGFCLDSHQIRDIFIKPPVLVGAGRWSWIGFLHAQAAIITHPSKQSQTRLALGRVHFPPQGPTVPLNSISPPHPNFTHRYHSTRRARLFLFHQDQWIISLGIWRKMSKDSYHISQCQRMWLKNK